MKKNKLLAVLLALAMTLSLLPTAAMAEGDVAQVGETEYADLSEAIAAADGKTVTLLENVTSTSTINIPAEKTIVLDLKGKTITINNGTAIMNYGTLTIKDSATGGKIVSNTNVAVGIGSNSKTTIESGSFESQESTVALFGDTVNATVTIGGGTFHAKDNAVVASNGSAREGEPNTVTINGGTFTGNIETNGYIACGIYAPWKDIITVNDGTFTVDKGIGVVARAGQTTINGGTFTCTGTAKGKVGDKNFDMDAAQALYFDASDPAYPAYNSETDFIKVTGGSFSSDPAAYLTNGFSATENSGTWTVSAPVAQIGDVKYGTIAAAVTAAESDDTVTLLKNVAIPATLSVAAEKNIILDLNGHTISDDTGLSGYLLNNSGTLKLTQGTISDSRDNEAGTITTIRNLGTLTIDGMTISRQRGIALKNDESGVGHGGTVTIANSEITASGDVGQAIQNWGTVTISSGTFNGEVNAWASVEWNPGHTIINGGTFNGDVQSLQWKRKDKEWPTVGATTEISGGVFNASIAVCYQEGGPQPTVGTTKPDGATAGVITVSGGTFSSDPSNYLAANYAAPKIGNDYVVGTGTRKVTFETNGGSTVASEEVSYGTAVARPAAPTRSGYTFGGWYSDSGLATAYDFSKPVISDITLYAKWTARSSSSGSSSGGGSSSSSSTTTEKNPDGSTTTTTTDKTTGTVTETTKNTDGSTTTVETEKDGTVTETNKAANGTTGTVVTDKNGDVTEVKSTVSAKAATEAAKTGGAVTLPVEVPAAKTTEAAPAVEVSVPKSTGSVKVEIPVEKVTPGTVAVIVQADGTEKIVSTSMVTENGVALKLDGSATVKIIDNTKTFSDVPATNVFYNEISSLSAREIMIGKAGDKFDLHSTVTLDQIANVAGRITGAVDVKDFSAGVTWGAESGLQTGNVAATRGEVLKALYIAAGSPAVEDTTILARFKDASGIPADMTAIAAWAAQNGILKGDLSGNANLTTNVTRGQACALAGRTMGTLA